MLKTADVECQWKLLTDWTRGSPYSSDSEKRERSADWSMSSPHSNHYASWILSADWLEGSPHSCHSKRYLQEPKIKQTMSARPQLIGSLSVSSNSRIIQNIILLNAVYCHVKRGRWRPSVNEYEINLTRSHFHRLVDRRFFFSLCDVTHIDPLTHEIWKWQREYERMNVTVFVLHYSVNTMSWTELYSRWERHYTYCHLIHSVYVCNMSPYIKLLMFWDVLWNWNCNVDILKWYL